MSSISNFDFIVLIDFSGSMGSADVADAFPTLASLIDAAING